MKQTIKATAMATAALAALAFAGGAQATADVHAGLQAMQELNVIVFGNLTSGHEIEGKAFVGGNVSGSNENFGIGSSANPTQGNLPSSRPTLTVVGNVNAGGSIKNGSNGGNGNVATVPGMVVGGNVTGNFDFNASNPLIQVGGNLSANNLNGITTLQVGGNLSGNLGSGTVAQVGGTFSGNNNGGTLQGLDPSFAPNLVNSLAAESTTLYTNLTALSTALAGLSTTAGSGIAGSNLNAVAGTDGFAVLNINASDLSGLGNLVYNFTPGLTTVINVTGNVNSGDWTFNNNNSAAYNPYVLFNFVDATTVDFDRIVHGSVLAPFATVYNHTPIEGTVVAQNLVQGGEVHLGTFGGGIDFPPPGDDTGSTVPEPATWAMLIAGFGLVGIGARRRRRQAA